MPSPHHLVARRLAGLPRRYAADYAGGMGDPWTPPPDVTGHDFAFGGLGRLLTDEERRPQASDRGILSNRNVVADWLEDNGRPDEAALLRDHRRHVVVVGGRVRPGRFTTEHVAPIAEALDGVLGRTGLIDEEGAPAFGERLPPHARLPGEGRRRPVRGHVFVWWNGPGQGGRYDHVGVRNLPDRLHDAYRHGSGLAHLFASPPDPAEGFPPEWQAERDEAARLLGELRAAPVEAIDHGHPNEQGTGHG